MRDRCTCAGGGAIGVNRKLSCVTVKNHELAFWEDLIRVPTVGGHVGTQTSQVEGNTLWSLVERKREGGKEGGRKEGGREEGREEERKERERERREGRNKETKASFFALKYANMLSGTKVIISMIHL